MESGMKPDRSRGRAGAEEPGQAAEGGVSTLELRVAGLECALCARRLETHLRALPGVTSARVGPGSGVLRVRFRPAEVSAANLHVEVRRAGFVPAGEHLRLRVHGMHCDSCAGAIQRALRALPGVERVHAVRETGEVRVGFLPEVTDPGAIEKAVTGLGYQVERP